MSVTVEDLRARVPTDLDTDTLQRILDAAAEEVVRAAGAASSETETHLAKGSLYIVLSRRHASITSIVERTRVYGDPTTLSTNDYREVGPYRLLRLVDGDNPGSCWGAEVVITYVPEVDADLRDRVMLDLGQLSIEFRAYESEKAGDWSGSQKDYNARRQNLLREIREGRSPFA